MIDPNLRDTSTFRYMISIQLFDIWIISTFFIASRDMIPPVCRHQASMGWTFLVVPKHMAVVPNAHQVADDLSWGPSCGWMDIHVDI